jgi:O-acetylhomoserine (thiol)-lyase
VGEGTVRLSVGLEDLEDLAADLDRGLAAAGAVQREGHAIPA